MLTWLVMTDLMLIPSSANLPVIRARMPGLSPTPGPLSCRTDRSSVPAMLFTTVSEGCSSELMTVSG